jgi:hypothetical protein
MTSGLNRPITVWATDIVPPIGGELMTKLDNRCAHCGGKFGLVSHHHRGLRFCREVCKENFLARTAKDYARMRKWFGLLAGPVIKSRAEMTSGTSLRRTKASLIYWRTGNLRAVQLLLGQTKIEKHGQVS